MHFFLYTYTWMCNMKFYLISRALISGASLSILFRLCRSIWSSISLSTSMSAPNYSYKRQKQKSYKMSNKIKTKSSYLFCNLFWFIQNFIQGVDCFSKHFHHKTLIDISAKIGLPQISSGVTSHWRRTFIGVSLDLYSGPGY